MFILTTKCLFTKKSSVCPQNRMAAGAEGGGSPQFSYFYYYIKYKYDTNNPEKIYNVFK